MTISASVCSTWWPSATSATGSCSTSSPRTATPTSSESSSGSSPGNSKPDQRSQRSLAATRMLARWKNRSQLKNAIRCLKTEPLKIFHKLCLCNVQHNAYTDKSLCDMHMNKTHNPLINTSQVVSFLSTYSIQFIINGPVWRLACDPWTLIVTNQAHCSKIL